MKKNHFKLALVQMNVKGGDKEWNMAHAVELISQAASNGADVALLPETIDLGWTHPSSLELAEEIPDGKACLSLIKAAKDNRIIVCSGLTEKAGDRVYNSAVIIDDDGRVLCKHRKLNELDIGHKYYAQGDRLNIAETRYGTFGLMICADGFAQDHVLSRSLCYMGADVILSPCAWATPGDHDNIKDPYDTLWLNSYIPVAKEFAVSVIGVSNVGPVTDGPWKGRNCIGGSIAVGPLGDIIVQGPYGVDAECILYADIKPVQRPARGTDWGKYWNNIAK